MTPADIPAADSLRALAGWNQTLPDWERFITCAPDGCFIAEMDGVVVGTATTISYGTDLAWIGMVLVHPHQRRHGIGTALLWHCLDHLRGRGLRCIKLDATPLGKMVYDRLGFRDEWTLTRWETKSAPFVSADSPPPDPLPSSAEGRGCREATGEGCRTPTHATDEQFRTIGVRPLNPADWEAIRRLDGDIFGVNREPLLRMLGTQSLLALAAEDADGGLAGFGMIRDGARASYLGPVVANAAAAGRALVQALVQHAAGRPVFWDVPDLNQDAVRLAKELGFTPQRTLMRMYLGDNSSPGKPALQFGIVAPEVG